MSRVVFGTSGAAKLQFVGRVDGKISDAKSSIIMWVVSAILLAQVLPPLLKKFGL